MKAHPESDYDWLERLYEASPSLPKRHEFRDFIRAVWSVISEGFSGDSNQPRIRKYFDIQGRPIWYVYDPVTKQSFTANSEFEMLNWLEGN